MQAAGGVGCNADESVAVQEEKSTLSFEELEQIRELVEQIPDPLLVFLYNHAEPETDGTLPLVEFVLGLVPKELRFLGWNTVLVVNPTGKAAFWKYLDLRFGLLLGGIQGGGMDDLGQTPDFIVRAAKDGACWELPFLVISSQPDC